MKIKRPTSNQVLVGGALVCLLTLYLTGFCFTQMRYVSDKEFIERALTYRAKYIKGFSPNPSHEEVQAYLRQNPKCCEVEGRGFFLNSSLFARLFGFKTTWVRVVHPLTDEEVAKSSGQAHQSDVWVGFNRCGRLYRVTGHHFLGDREFKARESH